MRRNKALNANTYVFHPGERVLVDANVWIYLQPPVSRPAPGYSWRYSVTLKNLLAAGATPIIEALVLSEYLNRYLRIEYEVGWLGRYRSFKDFRNSPDFASVALDAVGDARQILTITLPENTFLSHMDLPSILDETEAGTLDFNDGVLVETCRLRGWKLLTNDSDMTLGGIDVLTTNPRLLAACP
jgi:predicted nucleic acid-binding protein